MDESNKLRLPRLISNGMVLQRESRTRIWGWASPGEGITLNFLNKFWNTLTDEAGKWFIILENLNAGGPYEMEIMGEHGEKLTVKDILIGDVWLSSGQSNMQLPMERVKDRYPQEIEECQNNNIRMFKVEEYYNFHEPQEDLAGGKWNAAGMETILDFSATSYFFEKFLYEANQVPIGIINSSIGGTPIEAWMSEEALNGIGEYSEIIHAYRSDAYVKEQLENNARNDWEWYGAINQLDEGLKDKNAPWFLEKLEDDSWDEMKLPGFFKDAGLPGFIGVIWFRKKINIPSAMAGKEGNLWLGTIVDSDTVYLNGVKIGSTEYQYPPRKYKIPAELLKAGENTITIRVICNGGAGRFTPGKVYSLFTDGESIDLCGNWNYKIGGAYVQKPENNFISWKPTGLYNGMLAPCHNYTIKGFIWYQGESNTGNPANYECLFEKLIDSWRHIWKLGELPFLYVQLPNFGIDLSQEGSGWPDIREAQLNSLCIPGTRMIVSIDIGEENDLHPLNKKEIGYRLSLAARALAYHEEIVYSGPIYESMEVIGDKVRIQFTHAQGGLTIKGGGNPDNFQIAGTDRLFLEARAEIKGEQIIVWNEKIKEPAAVRYAYQNNPKGGLLYNNKGLPASPFRTDTW